MRESVNVFIDISCSLALQTRDCHRNKSSVLFIIQLLEASGNACCAVYISRHFLFCRLILPVFNLQWYGLVLVISVTLLCGVCFLSCAGVLQREACCPVFQSLVFVFLLFCPSVQWYTLYLGPQACFLCGMCFLSRAGALQWGACYSVSLSDIFYLRPISIPAALLRPCSNLGNVVLHSSVFFFPVLHQIPFRVTVGQLSRWFSYVYHILHTLHCFDLVCGATEVCYF